MAALKNNRVKQAMRMIKVSLFIICFTVLGKSGGLLYKSQCLRKSGGFFIQKSVFFLSVAELEPVFFGRSRSRFKNVQGKKFFTTFLPIFI